MSSLATSTKSTSGGERPNGPLSLSISKRTMSTPTSDCLSAMAWVPSALPQPTTNSSEFDQNHNPVSSEAPWLSTLAPQVTPPMASPPPSQQQPPVSHSNLYYEISLEKPSSEVFYCQTNQHSLPKDALGPHRKSANGSGVTVRVALAAAVSFFTNSLPSGFNMGVVNTPEEIFKEFFNHTMNGGAQLAGRPVVDSHQIELLWSIAVSVLLVGAFIGCIFTGYLADTIGRRSLLILNALIGLLGVSLCWLSKFLPSVPVFMAGRLIAGLHTGIGSSLVPMYLIEIAPKNMVTVLATLHVMGMNGGQTIAQILGLEPVLGSYSRWQLLFFVNSTFIILGLTVILLCPESPVYLFVMKRQEERAIRTLQSIRGQSMQQLVDDIFALRQQQKNRICTGGSQSLWTLLRRNVTFRRSLLVVCALHAGQQLIGINAVFYYSTRTFRNVGLSARTSQYSSIGCTSLNMCSSLMAIPLIRRFAPRNLLLASGTFTLVSLALLTLSMTFISNFAWLNYVIIVTILLYVFSFSIGQGPIPYMIGGELFDQSSMAIGMSTGCFVNWFCNFLIAITFPMITMLINQYVFLVFIAFNVLLMVFTYLKVPNTREPSIDPDVAPQMATIPNIN